MARHKRRGNSKLGKCARANKGKKAAAFRRGVAACMRKR